MTSIPTCKAQLINVYQSLVIDESDKDIPMWRTCPSISYILFGTGATNERCVSVNEPWTEPVRGRFY